MSSKRKSPPTKLEGGSQSNETTSNPLLSNSNNSNHAWTSNDSDKTSAKREKNVPYGIDDMFSVGDNDTNDHNNNGEDGNDNAGNALDCSKFAYYDLLRKHFQCE